MRWHMDCHQHGPKNACVPSHSWRLQRLGSPGPKRVDAKEQRSLGDDAKIIVHEETPNKRFNRDVFGGLSLFKRLYMVVSQPKFMRNVHVFQIVTQHLISTPKPQPAPKLNSALPGAPATFLPSRSSASCVSRPLPPLEAVQEPPLHGSAWCIQLAT